MVEEVKAAASSHEAEGCAARFVPSAVVELPWSDVPQKHAALRLFAAPPLYR